VTVYPAHDPSPPNVSTVNPSTAIAANFAITAISPPGQPRAGQLGVLSVGADRQLIIDLVGYYSDVVTNVGEVQFINPVRVLDTRPGSTVGYDGNGSPIQAQALTDGQEKLFKIAGMLFGGTVPIPSNATGLLMNVTIQKGAPSGGYVTVYPGDAAIPPNPVSTVNPSTAIAGNLWVSRIPTNVGTIKVKAAGTGTPTDVIVDVVGFYSQSNPSLGTLNLITPRRILDTREAGHGYLAASIPQPINVMTLQETRQDFAVGFGYDVGDTAYHLPSNVRGLWGNLTTVQATASGGYYTVFPAGLPSAPTVSTSNPVTNITAHAFATRVPDTGTHAGELAVFTAGTGQPGSVILDIYGYYRGPTYGTIVGAHYANTNRNWRGRTGWTVELVYASGVSDNDAFGFNNAKNRVFQAWLSGQYVLLRVD